MKVLVVNGGSSTFKCWFHEISDGPLPVKAPRPLWEAHVEWDRDAAVARTRVRTAQGASVEFERPAASLVDSLPSAIETLWSGGDAVIRSPREIEVAGHRIVHGGKAYRETVWLNPEVRAAIAQQAEFAPTHTEALAGLDRTQEVLHERPEDEETRRTQPIGSIQGVVSFEHVTFAYDPGKPVLHDVSFESKPGTATALVGPSGSGKSTIISLVAAFHEPTEGTVRVDGTDLSTVRLDAYRTQLGVVLQDTFLFDGSIRENVAFSRPDASEEEILEACRIAHVHEFAERFDKKYDTIVGERGVKLSGGQRQRVSIARAILANPRILILDEATSSLDSESEAAIQAGLSYLMEGRTTFVIAHRLSTIRRADQILVVEDGRIVERGTHESLYALGGRYYDLYTRQHGVDANLFLAPGEGDKVPETEQAPGVRAGAAPTAASLLRGGVA